MNQELMIKFKNIRTSLIHEIKNNSSFIFLGSGKTNVAFKKDDTVLKISFRNDYEAKVINHINEHIPYMNAQVFSTVFQGNTLGVIISNYMETFIPQENSCGEEDFIDDLFEKMNEINYSHDIEHITKEIEYIIKDFPNHESNMKKDNFLYLAKNIKHIYETKGVLLSDLMLNNLGRNPENNFYDIIDFGDVIRCEQKLDNVQHINFEEILLSPRLITNTFNACI
jgi:hypothetical protein